MARRLRRRLAVADCPLTSCDARRATRGERRAKRYWLSVGLRFKGLKMEPVPYFLAHHRHGTCWNKYVVSACCYHMPTSLNCFSLQLLSLISAKSVNVSNSSASWIACLNRSLIEPVL